MKNYVDKNALQDFTNKLTAKYKTLFPSNMFVSPEMYGAKGDGITDDTAAWQSAVNTGIPVKATKKNYKCGKITVTKNIEIDCNGADFTCTEQTLFECTGEVVTTLTNESDYAANDPAYTITDQNYANYTGFAMLKGTNNFEESRTYYYGGFVCTFKNGKMNGSYPIDATNVSIDIINPITVNLYNIGNIAYSDTSGRGIVILYGKDCIISNINSDAASKYTYISLKSCLNCECRHLHISQILGGSSTNSYIVGFEDSSFCCVKDSYLYNKYWHCVTTGDNYLCYHNSVINSFLFCDESALSYADHANGINTIIENCTCSSIGVGGLSVVKNVNIVSCRDSVKSCMLVISPTSDVKITGSHISDVCFFPDSNTPDNQCGIRITKSAQVTGKTYYVDNILIENVKIDGNSRGQCWFSFFQTDDGSNYVVKNVKMNNVPTGVLYFCAKDTLTNVDISDYVLYINNCTDRSGTVNAFMQLGATDYKFGEVIITNSKLVGIRGLYESLEMHNVRIVNSLANTTTKVKKVIGSGIWAELKESFFITGDATYNCSDVKITDMTITSANKWYNISNDNAGNKYYQKWVNGVLTTYQITTS